MFSKILIANRGEIAIRVIRAAKELGIKTVAIYSQADKDSLHLEFADEAICIGKAAASDSYLNIPSIISAVEITDSDAIHPGYGFLAENPHFAEICESCGVKFIGPSAENIRLMGDKIKAKEMMRKAGLPLISGSKNVIKSNDEALSVAKKMGYPLILKAKAGGGGKGMRVCHSDVRLVSALLTAQAEAEAAFGNSEIYIEKFMEKPRHIEVQIAADNYGNVVYLGERDCSIQRRHQKIIEETPSPAVNNRLRRKLGELSIKGVKSIDYHSVGTMEFLLDRKGDFHFMEMNTRIQVEHPVTEETTGIDLVKLQILLAAGEKLNLRQEDIALKGSSVECRINAEDPDNNFLPSPGKIEFCYIPGGKDVRVDTHIYSGYNISPYYDSLIAKLITKADTRSEALKKMEIALDEFLIEPIKTTVSFCKKIVTDSDFKRGNYHTGFLEKFLGTDEE
ncbi:MAG: acetyl-CoA carboxylase biotin carboxylase subunit [Candidatus Omnitrophica bacterium]|nr:acetyl-CoA carboxylase biotin carboxylase subunit [Candidatus Omnitrophota bacterium]MBU0878733.1 acetyl-CoA carboxylase biotin carboxylase subunit [Candidatus Omnitrophota bacterium]MBU1133749.1 acetyl-CoA carboxylase biotin carboxylase subunit [Candidatus Omnitrophota bacterium]MBU1366750.1 acetyl-CoA carboxylase biotin carboxylase subunit [Candidatus Omnitrophota bacterium]MBU1524136.1 acetyl-CoA carboxylase biotin carboxylase subunit [Candidatus Omnitrophota bacterium]